MKWRHFIENFYQSRFLCSLNHALNAFKLKFVIDSLQIPRENIGNIFIPAENCRNFGKKIMLLEQDINAPIIIQVS